MVIARPSAALPQPLCLDQGDDHPTGAATTATSQDLPHLRRMGEAKLDPNGQKTHPARRWVVERTLAWVSKCRGRLVRDEQKAVNV
jgi:hypothetical protein